jgi:hypothetical protein
MEKLDWYYNRTEFLNVWDKIQAEELMTGYMSRWGSDKADGIFEQIGVEQKFEYECGSGVVTGSIDATRQNSVNGLRHIIEHKTTNRDCSMGSPYWSRIAAVDSQVSTYMKGAHESGFPADECVYDVIKKVALKPELATPADKKKYTKATRFSPSRLYSGMREHDESAHDYRLRVRTDVKENLTSYFVRQTIVRLDKDHEEHWDDTACTIKLIDDAEANGMYPRHTNACERYNSECPYLNICSGHASIDDEAMFRTATEQHEELVK